MKFFGFPFGGRKAKDASAARAKDRLQILLAHERADKATVDALPMLQREIMEVVKKHMQIPDEAVDVTLERGEDMSYLEINIELPGLKQPAPAAP